MKSKTIVLASLASLGLIWFAPGEAKAFCIGWDKSLPNYDPRYYSVSHEFKRATYVAEIKVLHETWIGEDGKPKPLEPPFQNGGPKPWGFDPYAGAYYDVEVVKTFKGAPPRELRLFSENSTARFWLDVGSKHVFFITEETFDDPVGRSLTMDTCGNSVPIEKAAKTVRVLEGLAHRNRGAIRSGSRHSPG